MSCPSAQPSFSWKRRPWCPGQHLTSRSSRSGCKSGTDPARYSVHANTVLHRGCTLFTDSLHDGHLKGIRDEAHFHVGECTQLPYRIIASCSQVHRKMSTLLLRAFCKCICRMEHLGIKVKSMTEEEYCLIPMGGVLPTFPQRTLGIGGTGGMVHPSTGWLHLLLLAALLGEKHLHRTNIDALRSKGTGHNCGTAGNAAVVQF